MENSGAKITKSESNDIQVTIKAGTDDRTLYHNIINLMGYSKAVHGTDPQQIVDWLREKQFFSEHAYSPVV